MIIHDVEPGSVEWHKLRIGIPTASEFHHIVTPKGKLSSSSVKYAHRLIAELLLNQSLDSIDGIAWIDRGKELEPEAIRMYEFETSTKTTKAGFVTTDDGMVGCSPDRIVGSVGGLEIKSPAPQTHVGYMLDHMDPHHIPQVQGCMFVTERDWWDWYAYNPYMPPVRKRILRDEKYIKNLRSSLDSFNTIKMQMLERCRELGLFAEREKIMRPIDHLAEDIGRTIFAG